MLISDKVAFGTYQTLNIILYISSYRTMTVRWKFLLPVLVLPLFSQSIAVEPTKDLTESMLNFTLRFSIADTDNNNETSISSPYCLAVVLAGIQQGTRGDSGKQIDAALGFGHESSRSYFRSLLANVQDSLSDQVFHWGNKMYVRNDLEIDTDFQESIKENFNMGISKVNFSKNDFVKDVNDWISLVTNENIQDGIDSTFVTPDTFMFFATAISFSDEWDNPFNVRDTEESLFHINDTTNVTVPFMIYKNRNTIAGQNNEVGYKWIRLGYSKSPSTFMVFILPTKRFGLYEVMKNLGAEDIFTMLKENTTEMINIEIPKFNLTKHKMLQSSLRKLGVVDIFTKKANLSGMIKSEEEINVKDISHNCRVEINEKGTMAAAVATANFQFLSGSVGFEDNPVFRADEPFFFFLYDTRVIFPYFEGFVYNPRN